MQCWSKSQGYFLDTDKVIKVYIDRQKNSQHNTEGQEQSSRNASKTFQDLLETYDNENIVVLEIKNR